MGCRSWVQIWINLIDKTLSNSLLAELGTLQKMRLTFSSPSIANGLVPLEAVILAGAMMTKFASHVSAGREFDRKDNITNI